MLAAQLPDLPCLACLLPPPSPPTHTLQLKDGTTFASVHIEARMQLPQPGQGLWPAFWLFPTDLVYGKWAASGEIDIMESINDMTTIAQGLHYGGPGELLFFFALVRRLFVSVFCGLVRVGMGWAGDTCGQDCRGWRGAAGAGAAPYCWLWLCTATLPRRTVPLRPPLPLPSLPLPLPLPLPAPQTLRTRRT